MRGLIWRILDEFREMKDIYETRNMYKCVLALGPTQYRLANNVAMCI